MVTVVTFVALDCLDNREQLYSFNCCLFFTMCYFGEGYFKGPVDFILLCINWFIVIQLIINIISPQNASQSWSYISSFQYLLPYSVNIKVFGGEPGPAATLAPKLGPLGLVKYSRCRTQRKSVRTSSRRAVNGKESEWWFNSNAKTEQLKSQSTPAHQHSWSRNLETMNVTERKSRMLTTKEILPSNKSKRLPKSLRKNPWPRLSKEPSSKF